ncbi:MAG: sugar phosphate nucleotidyltransferase [Nanoarchaeota archaeon]
MKERVTLTIEKDLLEKVDQSIDGSKIKNRSHAVELLITKALGTHRPTKALILAGGKGLQLGNENIPKCMMRFKEKPILEYNIELLKKYGIKDIYLLIGDNSASIEKYFEEGKRLEVNIQYIKEKQPLGTAGPLHQMKNLLHDTFILMNGDEIKDVDLNDMYRFHSENNGLTTMAITTLSDPSEYGVVVLNGNQVMSFTEKPTIANVPSNLINAGLYILEPQVLELVPEGFAMLESDLFPKLVNMGKLYGYPFAGTWTDLNLQQKIKFKIRKIKKVMV